MEQFLSTIASCAPASFYLMGISFVFGSLFTVSMLLVLDFVREHITQTKSSEE